MKRYTRGFTLIELLVVIAIIGILSSVVLVSLNSARSKGKDTHIISDTSQLRTQIESDNNGSTYDSTNTFTVAAGVVTFTNTSGSAQAQIVADAATNAPTGYGNNQTTPTAVAGVVKDGTGSGGAGVAFPSANNAITIVHNGTPTGTTGWTTSPTAYAIWGRTSSSNWFCIDSTGGTKNGSTATNAHITCQ